MQDRVLLEAIAKMKEYTAPGFRGRKPAATMQHASRGSRDMACLARVLMSGDDFWVPEQPEPKAPEAWISSLNTAGDADFTQAVVKEPPTEAPVKEAAKEALSDEGSQH